MGASLKPDKTAAQNKAAQPLLPIYIHKVDAPSDMEL
jgi:hypothetical protein